MIEGGISMKRKRLYVAPEVELIAVGAVLMNGYGSTTQMVDVEVDENELMSNEHRNDWDHIWDDM